MTQGCLQDRTVEHTKDFEGANEAEAVVNVGEEEQNTAVDRVVHGAVSVTVDTETTVARMI